MSSEVDALLSTAAQLLQAARQSLESSALPSSPPSFHEARGQDIGIQGNYTPPPGTPGDDNSGGSGGTTPPPSGGGYYCSNCGRFNKF